MSGHKEADVMDRKTGNSIRQLRRDARRGDPYAMVELGRMYQTGDGVRAGSLKAWRWFEKANAHGLRAGGLMSELLRQSLRGRERRRLELFIRLRRLFG